MYLSKVEIESRGPLNPYLLHQILWKAFPGMPEADRPFLFRVETQRPVRVLPILMQSSLPPTQPESREIRITASKELPLRLTAGEMLRFSLCANPVKRLNEARCRVPFIHEDQQEEWLKRKLHPVADLLECRTVATRPLYFRKSREERSGKIVMVTFTGILRVMDAEGLVDLMKTGIGPAKSLGCGMLTLARR